jgi:quercetin dioxygenase-like cupin family protein
MKRHTALLTVCLAFVLFQRPASDPLAPASKDSVTEPAVPLAQEPAYQLAFENEYARVYRVEVPPAARTQVHQHNTDFVWVVLGPAKIRNQTPGLGTVTMDLQFGEAHYSVAPFSHSIWNAGDSPYRNISVELKKRRGTRLRIADDLSGPQVQVLFDSTAAKVLRIRLKPGEILPTHNHNVPHLVVALTDLTLTSVSPGKPTARVNRQAGQTGWVGGTLTHSLTNEGKNEADFVVIEFK